MVVVLVCFGVVGCMGYVEFDEQVYFDCQLESCLFENLCGLVVLFYQVSQGVVDEVLVCVRFNFKECDWVDVIFDYIFGIVGFEYELMLMCSVDCVVFEGKGNCMFFVNFFVGLGCENCFNLFYVEVKDYQCWNYQDGVVVSCGYIVVGFYVDGDFWMYDFLFYVFKFYKDFKLIEDLMVMVYYYNNLGVEVLMENCFVEVMCNFELVCLFDCDFDKVINNFGVVFL